jgi:WD40 repeat protein
LLHETKASHEAVRPVAFLDNNQRLILYRANQSLHEWNLETGNETLLGAGGKASWAYATGLSPDQRWCVSVGINGDSKLYDRSTGAQKDLALNLAQVPGIAFSPDGRLLAVVSWLGVGKLLGVADHSQPFRTFRGFLLGMNSVAFSPDSSRIVAGSGGIEALKLWDTTSLQELLTLEAEGSSYFHTAFSPDGNYLGARNGVGALHLWRAPSWQEIAAAEPTEPAEAVHSSKITTQTAAP